jgi:uncharacterized protein (TIGR02145 family)
MNNLKNLANLATMLMLLAMAFAISCSSDDGDNSGGGSSSSSSGTVGGRTVTIGDQTWMAENLNYDVIGSKCYYDSDTFCSVFGRLYDWAMAMDLPSSCNSSSCASQIQPKHRGICPDGWHIPSIAEWDKLLRYVDGTSGTDSPYINREGTAAKKLKATNRWLGNGNGTDDYGFAALPGGYGYSLGFSDAGYEGFWWTTDENDNSNAYFQRMYDDRDYSYGMDNDKSLLHSVRCIKDDITAGSSSCPQTPRSQ